MCWLEASPCSPGRKGLSQGFSLPAESAPSSHRVSGWVSLLLLPCPVEITGYSLNREKNPNFLRVFPVG